MPQMERQPAKKELLRLIVDYDNADEFLEDYEQNLTSSTAFIGTSRQISIATIIEIGFAFLPATIAMGLMSARYSERLVMRFGARHTLIPGLVLILGALALFTRAPVDGSWVEHILPVMLLLGFGAGMAFPALMSLAMSDVDRSEAGLASRLVHPRGRHVAGLHARRNVQHEHQVGALGLPPHGLASPLRARGADAQQRQRAESQH